MASNTEPAYERSAPNLYCEWREKRLLIDDEIIVDSGEKIEDEPKTARAHSHHGMGITISIDD